MCNHACIIIRNRKRKSFNGNNRICSRSVLSFSFLSRFKLWIWNIVASIFPTINDIIQRTKTMKRITHMEDRVINHAERPSISATDVYGASNFEDGALITRERTADIQSGASSIAADSFRKNEHKSCVQDNEYRHSRTFIWSMTTLPFRCWKKERKKKRKGKGKEKREKWEAEKKKKEKKDETDNVFSFVPV